MLLLSKLYVIQLAIYAFIITISKLFTGTFTVGGFSSKIINQIKS